MSVCRPPWLRKLDPPLAVGGCMNSTCLILVPVVTTGCTTVNKTVYTLQPVVPTLLCQPVGATGCKVQTLFKTA